MCSLDRTLWDQKSCFILNPCALSIWFFMRNAFHTGKKSASNRHGPGRDGCSMSVRMVSRSPAGTHAGRENVPSARCKDCQRQQGKPHASSWRTNQTNAPTRHHRHAQTCSPENKPPSATRQSTNQLPVLPCLRTVGVAKRMEIVVGRSMSSVIHVPACPSRLVCTARITSGNAVSRRISPVTAPDPLAQTAPRQTAVVGAQSVGLVRTTGWAGLLYQGAIPLA